MSIYICTIEGKDVFQGKSFEGCITHLNDLSKVRDLIKEAYNIEFEELSAKFTSYYWEYENISDNRDVKLVVYKSYIIE